MDSDQILTGKLTSCPVRVCLTEMDRPQEWTRITLTSLSKPCQMTNFMQLDGQLDDRWAMSYALPKLNIWLIICVQQAFLPPGTSPPDTIKEAECLLSLAHAERDLQHAEKRLADVRVKECKLHVQMYSLQAKKAAKRLGDTKLEIGRVSLVIRRRHLVVHPTATKALRWYGRNVGKCRVFWVAIGILNIIQSWSFLPLRKCTFCSCRLGGNCIFAFISNMKPFADLPQVTFWWFLIRI